MIRVEIEFITGTAVYQVSEEITGGHVAELMEHSGTDDPPEKLLHYPDDRYWYSALDDEKYRLESLTEAVAQQSSLH